MLRCHKCSRDYEDGTQRFCANDGGRLLRVDQPVEIHSRRNFGRRTPPGELMVETAIAPPVDFADETNGSETKNPITRFESFGIHSSNPTISTRDEEEITSDAHSLDSKLTKSITEEESATDFDQMQPEYIDYEPEFERADKRKFDTAFILVCLLGALLFVTGVAFTAAYFFRERESQQTAQTTPQNLLTPAPKVSPAVPENYVSFRNTKENFDGKLAEKFVGFSLAFPNNWQKNSPEATAKAGNFFDAANKVSSGLPIEQLLISWYDSRGTFEGDRETFPVLVKKLSDVYAKEIPHFRKVSTGATKINGLDGYEIRFEGRTADKSGESIKIWGRTVLLPVNKPDAKSGLVLRMLTTSLAPALSGAEDVGNKGELAKILETLKIEQ